MQDKDLPICPLYLGGCCPSASYSDYSEISYKDRKKDDKECCKAHRDLTEQEMQEWDKQIKESSVD